MKRPMGLAFAAILASCQMPALAVVTSGTAFAAVPHPACTMAMLKPSVTDDSPGMGRLGLDLTLTNHGSSHCILGLVLIAFPDTKRTGSVINRYVPGSNLLLAPGDAAVTQLVWSDGIGGNGPCVDARWITVGTRPTLGARSLPIRAHICALRTGKPSFTALPFSMAKR